VSHRLRHDAIVDGHVPSLASFFGDVHLGQDIQFVIQVQVSNHSTCSANLVRRCEIFVDKLAITRFCSDLRMPDAVWDVGLAAH
jgi:hypothetical protein